MQARRRKEGVECFTKVRCRLVRHLLLVMRRCQLETSCSGLHPKPAMKASANRLPATTAVADIALSLWHRGVHAGCLPVVLESACTPCTCICSPIVALLRPSSLSTAIASCVPCHNGHSHLCCQAGTHSNSMLFPISFRTHRDSVCYFCSLLACSVSNHLCGCLWLPSLSSFAL